MKSAARLIRQGGGIGPQEEVRAHLPAKSRDGRGVHGNAVPKRPLQFPGYNEDVFLPPADITERQADEFRSVSPTYCATSSAEYFMT